MAKVEKKTAEVKKKPAAKKTKTEAKEKKPAKKTTPAKPVEKDDPGEKKDDRYFEAVGRRKTATARVRIFTKGGKGFTVNDKPFDEYFPTFDLQESCSSALKKMKCFDKFKVIAKVKGGGVNAQAEAVRHGTARALVFFNFDFKKRLRRAGFLTRDPRKRERKKPGLKRARRAPQWKKR